MDADQLIQFLRKQAGQHGGSARVPAGQVVEGQFPGWPRDPADRTMQDGWFEGLPYPLQDMRPEAPPGQRHIGHRRK
jgi:hypothetical protein